MFKAVHYTEVDAEEVEEGDSKGVSVRWLITKDDGADNFAMRLFEVEPGGQTPLHSHNWEHEVFILDGQALVVSGDSERKVNRGYVVFIPPNMEHCFKNAGNGKLSFLCLVPYRK
ncbi:MAG: cupin domain-containing protein [Candidatus Bathyarchaeia archaeon]